MSYEGYPEYPQLYGGFEHAVTALDLLFNTGPEAPRLFEALETVVRLARRVHYEKPWALLPKAFGLILWGAARGIAAASTPRYCWPGLAATGAVPGEPLPEIRLFP